MEELQNPKRLFFICCYYRWYVADFVQHLIFTCMPKVLLLSCCLLLLFIKRLLLTGSEHEIFLRNLPLAIAISCALVTVIYVMTNVAFYTVVSPEVMLESPAVAAEFSRMLYGSMAWIMSLFVACSTIGTANGLILISSRYVT